MSVEANIVAVGARTAVGLRAESSAAAVRAAVSRVGEHPLFVDAAGEPLRCAFDKQLPLTLLGRGRMVTLVASALQETIGKVLSPNEPPAVVQLLLSLPDLRPGFDKREGEAFVRELQGTAIPGVARLDIEPVVGGHAAFFAALEMASRRLGERRIEWCVAGGVDSPFEPATLAWLESNNLIARDGVRNGFTPGEGAGMVALMTRGERVRRRLPVLARVRAVASGREPRSLDSEVGLLGEGLSEVVRRVTEGLHAPTERVDDIYCDINGERHRADEWGFTALRLPTAFKDATAYRTPVGSWGDVGAASGALGCVLATQAWSRGYARGPRALVWASSTTGLRGATVLEQGES